MGYTPPFTVSSRSLTLVAEIAESISSLNVGLKMDPKLRRINRLRSIHSSLAIEGNTLSLDDVTDIINGKRVLGNPREIMEVKNAFAVYDIMEELDPFDLSSLLKAHGIMMKGIIDDAGKLRNVGVGVYSGDTLIHMAPPSDRVPVLIEDLFEWAKNSDVHPLIKSCVFHYEFEFIHPFSDGNGRTGRLWHTLILSKWKEVMSAIPIESIVRKHQQEYYHAIETSTKKADSGTFIDFMLSVILESIESVSTVERIAGIADLNSTERRILIMIAEGEFVSASEVAMLIGMTTRTVERSVSSLRKKGYIYRHGSDKSGIWLVSL